MKYRFEWYIALLKLSFRNTSKLSIVDIIKRILPRANPETLVCTYKFYAQMRTNATAQNL